MTEATEHPLVVAYADALRKMAEETGEKPPSPFVIPEEHYRQIAFAAQGDTPVKASDNCWLNLTVDTGVYVELQPEGWIQGTKVPWSWIVRPQRGGKTEPPRRFLR